MSGDSIFLDTNIVLYLLSGDETVAEILDGRTIFVSFITELELLGYKGIRPEEQLRIESLLLDATIIDINSVIKKITIDLRKTNSIKLPDAIVAATAHYLNIPLMTADKDLAKLAEVTIVLYEK
jgi:predicted nucleic acid-binding protein